MITMPCCGHHGRLGNMMLQFAAAFGHCKRTGQELIIPPSPYSQYLSNLPKWVKITDQIPQMPEHYEEPHFAYKPIPTGLRNASIRGYFQSVRHWEDCAEDIFRIFQGGGRRELPEVAGRNKLWSICDPEKAVAVCVRRTDYLQSNDFHSVLGMDYYTEAMRPFNTPKTIFVLFSDDLGWCREHFVGDQFRFCDEKDHWVKLWAIAACDMGAIIAPSTYHFWGAWFGSVMHGGFVVWPRKWFGSRGPNHETGDICPESWLRL